MWNIPTKVANNGASMAGKHLAQEFNNKQNEVEKAITQTGIVLTTYPGDPASTPDPNESMLAEAICRAASKATFGKCTGAANTYVVAGLTDVVTPKAMFEGLEVELLPSATNTGVSTANVFGLGAKKVRTWDDQDLSGGELVIGRMTAWRYDPAADGGSGAWLIKPGDLPPEALPGVHFRLSQANTSIPNNAFTNVTSYATVGSVLNDSSYSGGLVTIGPRDAGKWLLLAGCVASITNVTQVRSDIMINASASGGHSHTAGATTFSVLSTHGPNIIDLVAGDTVGLRLFQVNSGAAANSVPGYLLGVRIGK